MELKIGVIGTGAIGKEHIERIATKIGGAKVTAVNDIFAQSAQEVAQKYGATYFSDPKELVNSDQVDAVLIASSDATHADFAIMAIEAGKYVFVEKPLAPTVEEAQRVIDAEVKHGKKLVQVGFMRRYDRDYNDMKNAIKGGKIGDPLMLHCAHRNAHSDTNATTEMSITGSVIHELDVLRWLLEEDYKNVQVVFPKSTRNTLEGMKDPQIVMIETQSGVRIDIESYVNCQYGYDIQCEVVGETGIVKLPDPAKVVYRLAGQKSTEIIADWDKRFIEAYDIEVTAWVNDVKKGEVNGPTAWDGYLATAAASAAVKSISTGTVVDVTVPIAKPAIYN